MNTTIILFLIALIFTKNAAAGPAALMALAGGGAGGGAPPAPGNNGHCDQVVIVRPPKKKPMEPIVIQQPSPYQPQPIYMAPPQPPPLPPGYPAGYPPPGYPLIPRYPRYDLLPQQPLPSSYPSPPQYEQPASYPTPPQQPYFQPRIDFGYRGQVNGGGPPPPWLYPYTQFFTQKTSDNGHREKHEHNNLDVLSPRHVLQIFIPLSSEYQESLNNKLSNGVSVPPRLEMADLQQQ